MITKEKVQNHLLINTRLFYETILQVGKFYTVVNWEKF